MSKIVTGVLGIAALTISLGVAQFAVGRDLIGHDVMVSTSAQGHLVNRSGKTDRPSGIAAAAGGRVVTEMSASNDTSIAIRIPRQQLGQMGKLTGKSARRPVACEAPASVLSEIAQHLESGRCVT